MYKKSLDMRHWSATLRNHPLDVSGFTGPRSSFTFNLRVLAQHHCHLLGILFLTYFTNDVEGKKQPERKERRVLFTGFLHAANVIIDLTNTVHLTTLWVQ